MCQICATQVTTNVPHSTPSGSHPLPSTEGSGVAWEMHCRSQECWLSSPHWEINSPFLEVGTRRWPTSKDKEVWSNCNIYNSTSLKSSGVPRQDSRYMLYGFQSNWSPFHRKKYFSASFLYSSFLVYVTYHCGLAGSVQEEIHPMWPSYTDSLKWQVTVVDSLCRDRSLHALFCLQELKKKKKRLEKMLHRKCMIQFY